MLDLLKRDGWHLAATKGNHRQFKHPTKPGRVTVAGKPGDDLAPDTLQRFVPDGCRATGVQMTAMTPILVL